MVIRVDEVMDILQILAEKNQMKVTLKEALKGATCSGIGAFGGAIIAGPVGMMVGGVVGSTVGYFMSTDFKSVYTIISELEENEKLVLYNRSMTILTSFDVQDIVAVNALIQGNPELVQQLVRMLENYLEKDKKYTVSHKDYI